MDRSKSGSGGVLRFHADDAGAVERHQEDVRADLQCGYRVLPAQRADRAGVHVRETRPRWLPAEPEERSVHEAVQRVAARAAVELERVRTRLLEARPPIDERAFASA